MTLTDAEIREMANEELKKKKRVKVLKPTRKKK